MDYNNWNRFNNISAVRADLMEKYMKGVISSGEMYMLNQIEENVDEIIKQRENEIDSDHLEEVFGKWS